MNEIQKLIPAFYMENGSRMKLILPILVGACLYLFAETLFAQEDLSVFNYWNYYENVPSVSLYKHLVSQASKQLDTRSKAIAKLKTKAEWQSRQADVRIKLTHAMGPFPEKTPLNPVVTGTLQRDDFRVEKLYFESRPGYFVTAAIFIPTKRAEKSPAILYCSGHSPNGFRSDVYQRIILNYVKKGFIVLAFDPIGQGERLQYQGGPVMMKGEDEHSYPGAQSFISGLSPANYFTWDGVRAVDYLVSRKEVDASRIGIAGRSGGGTQATYIAAMDERILAAAPECYITTFDKLLKSKGPQDAEQNLMHGIANGIDMADFLEVRAPKPTLIVSTTRDMFSIQGTRDVYQEVQKAYGVFGKKNHLHVTEDDAGHASTLKNREASYAFFQKYLSNPGSSEEVNVSILSDKDLYVTPEGQIQSLLKGETMFSLNLKFTKGAIERREKLRKSTLGYRKELLAAVISKTGYERQNGHVESIFSGRLQRSRYSIEKYLVKGSGDYYLPVLWFKPKKSVGKTVLLLHEQGKAVAARPAELADQLADQGIEVILPDLSGIGELGSGYIKGGDSEIDGVPLNLWFTGIQTYKSLVAVRAEEIGILTTFIKNNSSPSTKIAAVAAGTLTSDLLHAAVIQNAFDKLVLVNPLLSWQSIADEKYYKTKFVMSSVAGALATYDLPDLASMSGKKLLALNPVNGAGVELEQVKARSVYSKPLVDNGNDNPVVKCALSNENILSALMEWIR